MTERAFDDDAIARLTAAEREVLTLWWQEAAGELTRAEVAAALAQAREQLVDLLARIDAPPGRRQRISASTPTILRSSRSTCGW